MPTGLAVAGRRTSSLGPGGKQFHGGDQGEARKRSKGTKRTLWLSAQMETLKKEGRWLGGDSPDPYWKSQRIAADCALLASKLSDVSQVLTW